MPAEGADRRDLPGPGPGGHGLDEPAPDTATGGETLAEMTVLLWLVALAGEYEEFLRPPVLDVVSTGGLESRDLRILADAVDL